MLLRAGGGRWGLGESEAYWLQRVCPIEIIREKLSFTIDRPLAIKIPRTKFVIHRRFQGAVSKPLVIFVHGLTCNMDLYLYRAGAEWFAKQGFATYRFDLYTWKPKSRKLRYSTLRTHAQDIETIVRHFRRQEFDGAALWDPSYRLSFKHGHYGFPGGQYIRSENGYLMPWSTNVLLGKAMVEEAEKLDWDHLPTRFTKPVPEHIMQTRRDRSGWLR